MVAMRGMLLVLLYVSHSSASCGVQNIEITDATKKDMVRSKEFPWMVSLQDSLYTHLAFGSILSEFWILSIASAFKNRKDAVAIVGIAKMDAKLIFHKEYPVNTIVIHEEFDNKTMVNNIALLKTDTAIQFSNLVKPICFLGKKLHVPPTLQNCWVAGWNPTSATGHRMTMSILRKISVIDMNLCPFPKAEKMGCGNHIEQETETACLGDPGNPMMCQLQHLNLWVLRGILTQGGEECPGLFRYIKVEDYSDWITDKTKKTSPPLSSFYHWNNLVPFPSFSAYDSVIEKKPKGLSQVGSTQTFFEGQKGVAGHLWAVNGSRGNLDVRGKGIPESIKSPDVAVQPMYYDYYGGDVAEDMSGQNRLHQPQEIILFFFVLVFFCSGIK